MLGFKEYLTTSFDVLLTTRIRNFFVLYYGKLLPLLVENKEFFFNGDQEITVFEGTFKTIILYNGTNILAPDGKTFVETIKPQNKKYYEFAADYLLKAGFLNVDPNDPDLFNSPPSALDIKFFEELYKFKKEISLKLYDSVSGEIDAEKVGQYFDYLKTEEGEGSDTTTVYEALLAQAIGGDKSVINLFDKNADDTGVGASLCCKFNEKPPALILTGDGIQLNPAGTQEEKDFNTKLFKIIKESKKDDSKFFSPEAYFKSKAVIRDTLDTLTDEQKCYLCKRKGEPTSSVIAFIEARFDKINDKDNQGIANRLNCKSFGYSSARGNVKGGTVKGQAAAKCPAVVQPPPPSKTNLNYSKKDLQESLTAVDYNSGYFVQFENAVKEVNDKIDQNLITLINGE